MTETHKRRALDWALIAIIVLALFGAALYLSAIFGWWVGWRIHSV